MGVVAVAARMRNSSDLLTAIDVHGKLRLTHRRWQGSSLVALVILALTSACSGSSGSTRASTATATNTPLTAEAFQAVATTAADLVLLRESDFPPNWTGSPHTPTPLAGFTGPCSPLNPDDPVAGSSVSKSSEDFAGPGGDDALSQVDVFTSADAASASFKSLANVIAQCHDQFVSVFTNLFSQAGAAYVGISDPNASVTDVQVSFDDVRGPGYGDASQSYRLSFGFTVVGRRVSGTTDAIFMQRGAIVADITHTALSGDTTLTQRLAQAVADRLASANGQLPH
jgi:hypothetical protein